LKQVVQNYNTGELRVEDVPVPVCKSGGVLVRTAYSLISAGTERMKVDQARMSLIAKARARPDKVKQVIQSIKQVGLAETMNKVRERLDALTPLGYSLAGVVVDVGRDIDDFAIGDRVACAGEGIACHAEFVSVPHNLCVHVPDNVELKDAAFATCGAIAMNGVRQAGVSLGDTVLVIGLGLIGLLGVQILKAAGCRVIGVDLDPAKLELAKQCGADLTLSRSNDAIENSIYEATDGIGADAAYIAASTKSSAPMKLAGDVVRDRGKVVIVGMVPIEADWQTYYHKELSVLLARSYGPGRYDRNYEMKGIDYTVGYVRWTQRRNLEEFARLIGDGRIQPSRMLPHVHKFDLAPEVYKQLHEGSSGDVAMLFEYPADAPIERKVLVPKVAAKATGGGPVGVGFIGAGNFTTATLIPAIKHSGLARMKAICSAGGLTARSAAGRHGFEYCASDYKELLADKDIHAVVIATHHDTHARFAAEALRAGKHVFVEKPLAMNREQLDDIIQAQSETGRIVMTGFNRRFSPMSVAIREFFHGRTSPIEVVCRVNAGAIKADSWYQDAEEGGWRILSEGCHFIDLIQFLCGSKPADVFAEIIGGTRPGGQNDNCAVTIKMEDGSLGTLVYVANGDPGYEKERVEVFGQGRTAVIENWQVAKLFANNRHRKVRPAGTGKGHAPEMVAFLEAVRNPAAAGPWFNEAIDTTLTTFAILESIRERKLIQIKQDFDNRCAE